VKRYFTFAADNRTDFPLSEFSSADRQGIFETDPNTGNPWSIAGINAAQFLNQHVGIGKGSTVMVEVSTMKIAEPA
jgi:hypothetical protein